MSEQFKNMDVIEQYWFSQLLPYINFGNTLTCYLFKINIVSNPQALEGKELGLIAAF